MAVNFNKDSVFNLKPISLESVRGEIDAMLVTGEQPVMAFQTIRDQLVFTNKRIISIDVQGVTGKRKSYTSMPFSKVQFFTVQTPGFMELFPDTELFLVFSNGFTATFEIKGRADIGMLSRAIGEYVLN